MRTRFIDRKAPGLEHADHFAEVLGLRVARAENVQFLLHEEARFVSDLLLGVADVDNAAGESDLFQPLRGRSAAARWLR